MNRLGQLQSIESWERTEGSPAPLGATWVESEPAWNFALFSRPATGVTLLWYSDAGVVEPVSELRLDPLQNKAGPIWHCVVPESAVPSAPGVFRVRVWEAMSRGRAPTDVTTAAGGCECCLRSQNEGDEKAKPALGLAVQPLTPSLAQQLGVRATQGLVVQNVMEGSPAADAGFERGDVIVEVNKKPVKSVAELRETLAKNGKGSPMLFRVQRQDASILLTVTV